MRHPAETATRLRTRGDVVGPDIDRWDEEDVREMFLRLFERVESAIAAARDRDDRIQELWAQLSGESTPGPRRWQGSCELEDPLTAEHFYDVLANVVPGWERPLLVVVQPIGATPPEHAEIVERWINEAAMLADIHSALYRLFYYANAGLYGVMRVYWDVESANDPVLGSSVVYSGVRFRVPSPTDFYLYPASAASVEDAICTVERMHFTREELLRGIDEWNLDEEAVRTCIARRAAYEPSDADIDRADAAGVSSEGLQDEDTPITCYYIVGTVPLISDADGNIVAGGDAVRELWEALVCPSANTVLFFRPYRYREKPYVLANAIEIPGQIAGTGTVALLEPLQQEATALLRAYIDSLNLAATPALITTERNSLHFGKQRIYPGAVLRTNNVEEIRPLTWNMQALAQMEEAWRNLFVRASGLATSQGRPLLAAGPARKATEVQSMEQMVAAKFSLMFSSMQRAIRRTFEIILDMYAMEAQLSGILPVVGPGPDVTIVDHQVLNGRYRFVPTPTTETANPEQRAAQVVRKMAIQDSYLQAVVQLPPQLALLKYNAAREALLAEQERRPEKWLGPPPVVPSAQQLEEVNNAEEQGAVPAPDELGGLGPALGLD